MELYLVGGILRDALLSQHYPSYVFNPKDIDVMVVLPETTSNEAEHYLNQWITKHNLEMVDWNSVTYTARVKLSSGKYIDLSIARKELKYELARIPICAPASSVQEDMKRRDLTINALAFPVTLEQLLNSSLKIETLDHNCILDYYQGIEHIKSGLLKTPRSSREDITFTEDPLRVLRVCRFKSKLDAFTGIKWKIDTSITAAWRDNTEQIISRVYTVSTERVMEELNKMLRCQSLSDTLDILKCIPPKLLKAFLRDELSLKAVVKQKDK